MSKYVTWNVAILYPDKQDVFTKMISQSYNNENIIRQKKNNKQNSQSSQLLVY